MDRTNFRASAPHPSSEKEVVDYSALPHLPQWCPCRRGVDEFFQTLSLPVVSDDQNNEPALGTQFVSPNT